ncbi:MAG: AI-2E family transporter [Synechococcus sp. BS301-5m-G54]|jgi:predicted PurR-regulated permease PerM|uniref:AI-2E family transporter n=1 Tax=Synechococcales TaxID=1890424 RepID=UPI0004E0A577|nr:AI-2E family transporter [Synechococcus sp. KORDI-49]MBL6739674.1 AI-2E family transporter [Synechococcus sp. BS301-5m-G54]MBL6795981.1 AI-2E family transporter [Synechococcus sp. BS307-5m-G34]OUW66237.1 MAG: AI-2E family transporter [Synechococcus sp. TMED205]RCL54805.1 MAG: AI-2E family transporter [Synechococcus sp. MED-G70]HCX53028.1 AI-2E family transporter [Synechococcus sp. UBA9887]|tara:strand:+ start:8646 stop:9647 length:1002 start_codon:yes stop_codon:yes gene_type:complete
MNSRSLLIALTSIGLALMAWHLRWVLLVLFGAVVVAVALDVLITQLMTRTRLNRPQALSIVLVLLLLAAVIVAQLLLPELITQIQQLGRDLPELLSKLNTILATNPRFVELDKAIGGDVSLDQLQPLGSRLLGMAGNAANSVVQLGLMTLLAVLLALDPASHRQMVVAVTPRPARVQMVQLLDACRTALGGWLSGMTISATTVFLLSWAGLSLLKAPLALLSALVCGLLTFVPTIGPTTATLLPAGLALLQSPELTISVLVFRLVLQNLEAFVLTPLLLRQTVNLLPTVALTAQLSLGALLGLPGVLLALPLVVVMQVGMQRVVVQQVMDQWP